MLIFIDDSGDPGFRMDKGSTRTFVICCIIFDDELEAEKTAIAIKEVRRKLKKPDYYEFKFNKCSREYRTEFLKAVAGFKFRIRALVMKKEEIYSPELKRSRESFYNFTIKTVLKYNEKTIKNAKIRLDGRGSRLFRQSLLVYLRKSLNTRERTIIDNIRFRDSNKDVLIQLADMIAGSVGRTYQKEKSDRELYLGLVKKRVEDIWEFK